MRGLIAIAMLSSLAGCTDEDGTRQALRKAGYSEVSVTGYAFFTCGEDDNYSTGFRAKNPAGAFVSGTVCCARFKGCTIRF